MDAKKLNFIFNFSSSAEEFSMMLDYSEELKEKWTPMVHDPEVEEGEFVENAYLLSFWEGYEVLKQKRIKSKWLEIQVIKPVFDRFVKSIRNDDSILFIDGHNRNNLYELLITELHDHPSFSYHIANIQKWHDEFFKSFTNGKLSLSQILKLLQKNGSELKTESALKNWLVGAVLCPKDGKDLTRLAEILEIPLFKNIIQ